MSSRVRAGIAGASALGCAALFAAIAALAPAKPPSSFNPVVEAQNFSMVEQRQTIYDTPQYQAQLTVDSVDSSFNGLLTQAADPQRNFTDDLCWNHGNGCAGDIRLNDWANNGNGLVRPVLFTARNGATISGHIWATVAGPRKRPGIVITPGSVQADEQMYWYAAQALAKAGFVVLTFDAQGQGMSDTLGQSPDQDEGVPAQTTGTPFYDGTEDALDFLLSTPKHPYEPVRSCTSGTSHAAKQSQRVAAGLDSPYNPFWQLLDSKEIGLAGHSYGAAGVSYIGQWDRRVKAIVAWDDLAGPGPNDAQVPGSTGGSMTIGENGCPADPADRTTAKLHTPALGMSADYGLPPEPNTSLPNPEGKSTWSLNYSKAHVDSGQIIVKGGSHLDFSFIPNQAFGASLRGPDMITWYTVAWFDKYLGHERAANKMLLTTRWQHDPLSAAVDPGHDGNAFSFYYYSRLDIHLNARKKFDCEDLRDGCRGMVKNDGYRGIYSYLGVDTNPDAVSGPGARFRPASSLFPCPSRDAVTFALTPLDGLPITTAVLYLDGRLVGSHGGTLPGTITIQGLAGKRRHTISMVESTGLGLSRTVTRTLDSCSMGG